MTPKVYLELQGQLFKAEINEVDAHLTDLRAAATWMFNPSFGLGIGYNRFATTADSARTTSTDACAWITRGSSCSRQARSEPLVPSPALRERGAPGLVQVLVLPGFRACHGGTHLQARLGQRVLLAAREPPSTRPDVGGAGPAPAPAAAPAEASQPFSMKSVSAFASLNTKR